MRNQWAAPAVARPVFPRGRRDRGNSADAVICAALLLALVFLACRLASVW
jgi:hypothetical protein